MSVLPNEGNQNPAGGSDAKPTPSANSDQPLEEKLSALNTSLDGVLKKLDAHDGTLRALQSGKDKAVDRAVGAIQPLTETVAKIAKYLNIPEGDVLKAQREMTLDDLVTERMKGSASPVSPASGTAERRGNAAELQIIDDLLELPTNDSRVTQLKLDYGHDTNAYKEQAKALRASLQTQSQPTPAEQLMPEGKSPPPQDLMKEFESRSKGLRGNDLINLKMEFRKRGLAIT